MNSTLCMSRLYVTRWSVAEPTLIDVVPAMICRSRFHLASRIVTHETCLHTFKGMGYLPGSSHNRRRRLRPPFGLMARCTVSPEVIDRRAVTAHAVGGRFLNPLMTGVTKSLLVLSDQSERMLKIPVQIDSRP